MAPTDGLSRAPLLMAGRAATASGSRLAGPIKCVKLVDKLRMATTGEGRGEERLENRESVARTDEPGAERQHVRVVVLARVGRARDVVAERRANAENLFRVHAAADPGAVDHDARGGTSAGDRPGHLNGKVGVVDGILGDGAEV